MGSRESSRHKYPTSPPAPARGRRRSPRASPRVIRDRPATAEGEGTRPKATSSPPTRPGIRRSFLFPKRSGQRLYERVHEIEIRRRILEGAGLLRDVHHDPVRLPRDCLRRLPVLIGLHEDQVRVLRLHLLDDLCQMRSRWGNARLWLEGLDDLEPEALGQIDEVVMIG